VNAALVLDGNSSLSIGSQVGIGIAITFAWAVLNALRIDKQGWLNNLAAFVQISSAIIIAIVLLVMAPQRATAKDVFYVDVQWYWFSAWLCILYRNTFNTFFILWL
jgi:hypothetical protein